MPIATEIDAVLMVAIAAAVLCALIAWETWHYAELRDKVRHQLTELSHS